jgi:hypothetical protein
MMINELGILLTNFTADHSTAIFSEIFPIFRLPLCFYFISHNELKIKDLAVQCSTILKLKNRKQRKLPKKETISSNTAHKELLMTELAAGHIS